jgi:hypothetical protein
VFQPAPGIACWIALNTTIDALNGLIADVGSGIKY